MQKTFSEILSDIKAKSKTSLLICVTMLIASAAMLLTQHSIGWLFAIMGIVLAVSLYSKNQRTQKELSKVRDYDDFCEQYVSDASTRLELLGLTITDDYAVVTIPYLQIFSLDEMEKFEVGLQGDIRKVLFLTDKNGERHRIAETQKGDALQKEFDIAYETVRKYFNGRNGA